MLDALNAEAARGRAAGSNTMLRIVPASGDAEFPLLRSPAVRKRAGKHGHGEIGGCAPMGDGFHDARRHEGERGEVSDVALDLVLASGDLLE